MVRQHFRMVIDRIRGGYEGQGIYGQRLGEKVQAKAPPRSWLHSLTYFIEFMISSLNLCHLDTLPTHE